MSSSQQDGSTGLMEQGSSGHLAAHTQAEPRAERFAIREGDWRVGAVVYQVFVDRYAPPADLDAKRHLYPEPRILHEQWTTPVRRGTRIPDAGVTSHELEYWGGDLDSVRTHLDHIVALDADVVYLNPIVDALTNHKYDANDYRFISPEYGDRDDLRALAAAIHERGMKLMLDGVFNHTGRSNPRFKEALADPASEWRDWYVIDDMFDAGYRCWFNVRNLPELNLENPAVREELWDGADSVVRTYLRDGADGWRLDVAYDLGFEYLRDLTDAAHAEKPGSWTVGELWSYPDQWLDSLDGVMNFHLRAILLRLANGTVSAPHAARLIDTMIEDANIEGFLKSWIVLDNHDTPRLKHMLPDPEIRRLAQTLQFTLPGAPVIYYGSEIGMDGADDPFNRGPMRWDWLEESDEAAVAELDWMKSLVKMRRTLPALRIGDYRSLPSERVFAFQRETDRRDELVIVVANPSANAVDDVVPVRDARQMGYTPMICVLSGEETRAHSGLLHVTIPPRTVRVFAATSPDEDRYTPYKRQ